MMPRSFALALLLPGVLLACGSSSSPEALPDEGSAGHSAAGAAGGGGADSGGTGGSGEAAGTGGSGGASNPGGKSGAGGKSGGNYAGGAAGSSGTSGAGGSAGAALPPVARTLGTQGLLPSPAGNLILDPFATADTAWGHFYAYFVGMANDSVVPSLRVKRLFLSDSPSGVTAPVAIVTGLTAGSAQASFARLNTKIPAGSGAFDVELWVSAIDDSAKPIPYANDNALIAFAFDGPNNNQILLTADLGAKQTIGAYEWIKFAATMPPKSLTNGGWVSVKITDLTSSWLLATPRVLAASLPAGQMQPTPPAEQAHKHHSPPEAPHRSPSTNREPR